MSLDFFHDPAPPLAAFRAAVEPAAPPGHCQVHRRVLAENCDRCGDFGCDHCMVAVEGNRYCQVCYAGGRVAGWLESYRQSLLGKRDGSTWLVTIGIVAYLATDAALRWSQAMAAGQLGAASFLVGTLLWMAVALVFFAGNRTGRTLLLVAPLVRCTLEILFPAGRPPEAPVLESLVVVVFSTIILHDTRNRLFFRLPVDDSELRDLYLNLSNRWARASLAIICALAVMSLSFFSPPYRQAILSGSRPILLVLLSLIALLCGTIGFRKVNLEANPPVGGRASALAGMFLSILWLLFLVAAC